jgi:glycerol-3-phosphate O-acyltransferase 3/4
MWEGNRVVLLTVGWIIFLGLFFPIHIALKGHDTVRKQLEVSRDHPCTLHLHSFVIVPWLCIVIECWFCGNWFFLYAWWLMYWHCYGCLQRGLVEFMCSVFVASWTGVVKYHGPRPSRRAKQVPSSFIRILSLTLLQVSICSVLQTTGNWEVGLC